MSTFKGKFEEEEFEDIVIDDFTETNYNAKAFFLSHCHTDHMRGMQEPAFHNLFNQDYVRLYCSEISKELLLKNYNIKIPPNKITVLNKYGNNIKLSEETSIRVTYLPAGHCPGSIMFLFEGFGKKILYTGDFRLVMGDVHKMKPLHMPGDEIVPLDALYFDSTFADPLWETFPTREESLESMKNIIVPWLEKDPANKIIIDQPAYIGMEYLMMELSSLVDPPRIHITNHIHRQYLSAMSKVDVITTNPEDSKIHFCYRQCSFDCFRRIVPATSLLSLYPRAMSFTEEMLKSRGSIYYDSPNKVKLAYSSHPSFKEIREFISYLKPAKIYPCVVPGNKSIEEFTNDILFYMDDFNDSFCESSPKKEDKEKFENNATILKDLLACSPKKARVEERPFFPGFESPPR